MDRVDSLGTVWPVPNNCSSPVATSHACISAFPFQTTAIKSFQMD